MKGGTVQVRSVIVTERSNVVALGRLRYRNVKPGVPATKDLEIAWAARKVEGAWKVVGVAWIDQRWRLSNERRAALLIYVKEVLDALKDR